MHLKTNKSVELFNSRAEHHKDFNAVLDAGDGEAVKKSNLMHDYFSKRYVIENVSFNKRDIVLDFGCGVGRLTEFIAPKVSKVIGFDASIKMLQLAKANKGPHNIRYVDSLDSLTSSSFDKIISHWVFAHISTQDIESLASVLQRILKDRGKLILFEQVYINKENKVENEVYIRRSLDEYRQLFEKMGFKLTANRPVYRTPSYARSIWNKLSVKHKYLFPILYLLERFTLTYRPKNIEYITYFFEFTLNERRPY